MIRRNGLLHWVPYAMLGLVALTVLVSNRDLSQAFINLQSTAEVERDPILVWAYRGVSVLLVAISVERVVTHIASRRHLPSAALILAFILYWLGTVAAPAIFGSHPQLSHEYLYTLIIGFAAALATTEESDKLLAGARTALFLFLLAGVLLVPVSPAMMIDNSYSRGLLPGVPRLGGLAPHPVALGMLALMFLLCLWSRPFENRWLNGLAWPLGLAVLFFAQSKMAWIAFILCSATMLATRQAFGIWRRVGNPRQGAFGVLVCVVGLVSVLALLAYLLMADVGAHAAGLLATPEGDQLMTMTGRDKIWAIAIEEWQANRMFGYGPSLWDKVFRASIGMPHATSAHNQFMDTLSRSGTVGAAAMVLYACVLLALSVRYAGATGGFSLALFLALALRSISEVPLTLFGMGSELLGHLLLIATLAAAAGRHRPAMAAQTHSSTYTIAS